MKSWTHAGFWLLLGLSAGMIVSDLARLEEVKASGSTSFNGEYRMVTGHRNDTGVDVLWLLDYRAAKLYCIQLNQHTYKFENSVALDLIEQLDLKGGSRVRPKFMMATGAFAPVQTDVVYLADLASGKLLCIMPPYVQGRGGRNRAAQERPTVVDMFRFEPDSTRAQ